MPLPLGRVSGLNSSQNRAEIKISQLSTPVAAPVPTRDAEAWGSGDNLPHNLEAVGAPQLWIVGVVYFYFCLFLHANLGLPEIVGQIWGVFSFG